MSPQSLLLLSALLLTTHAFTPPLKSYIPSHRSPHARQDYDDDQDDVEFFDLDDLDDDYTDDTPELYNGIIPNPLLDAMDPDGVYERLGPELFRDWTFWRDTVLLCVFLAFFTKDTHHYGYFDSVIEGLEDLPNDFNPVDYLDQIIR
jgi:hypothetical protein